MNLQPPNGQPGQQTFGWQAETAVVTPNVQSVIPERAEIEGDVADAMIELVYIAGFVAVGQAGVTVPTHAYRMRAPLSVIEEVMRDALEEIEKLKRSGNLSIATPGDVERVAERRAATDASRG